MANESLSVTRTTAYKAEKQIMDYFVQQLEHHLAGRHIERIVHRQPIDVCRLGVISPWRKEAADENSSLDETESDDSLTGTDSEETTATGEGQKKQASASSYEGKKHNDDDAEDGRESVEGNEDKVYTRRPPSSLGLEALVAPENGKIEVELDIRFAIYTRHFPSYREQLQSLDPDAKAPPPEMYLADICKLRVISVAGLKFSFKEQASQVLTDSGIIQKELDRVIDLAKGEPDILRNFPGHTPKVKSENMISESHYEKWLETATSGLEKVVTPFKAKIELRAHPYADGNQRISAYLINNTPSGTFTEDNFNIFGDAQASVKIIKGTLVPIEILPVPKDYQYNREVWAVGHNTSVDVSADRTILKTQSLARYEQPRLTTQSVPPAKFEDLANDPFRVLGEIYDAMKEFASHWQDSVAKNSMGLNQAELAECEKDLCAYQREVDRFAQGVASFSQDERLLESFKGMNRVMYRIAKGYDQWRLFQIVFIITQLPTLILREGVSEGEWPEGIRHNWDDDLNWADVLWFPTGGGKTEAYLGLISCAILYDRLRGKDLGITAWLRFPLRMLSVQQLQRAMGMIWETERERKNLLGEKAKQSDPVLLGYFVGSTTTPNDLNDFFFQKHPDAASCENYRVVPDCPNCKGKNTVIATPDKQNFRLRHICSSCGTELPLVVTDSEVYRFLPSLLIGTVDKMATIGLQKSFGILWAGPKWCCPKHGYSFGEYCGVFGCEIRKKKDRKNITPYDPSPTFHIQDELHLLQEELGTFAGHYETLTRFCEKEAGGHPAKIIAATATIEGFEHQAKHLYGVSGSRRFPSRGYIRHESFYATLEPDPENPEEPKTARVYVAFRPPGGNPSDAAAECAKIIHETIVSMIKNPFGVLAALSFVKDEKELRELLYYYSATLTYVGSLQGGTRIKDLLHSNSDTVHRGLRDMNIEYLSGRSSSGEVSEVIHRVDQPPKWEDPTHLDSIVATNMISHGVDLERFNLMVMDRFPAETSEYIQASSRSGRKKVGLVAVVLPNYNLRAASIYNRFKEYHEHLDRMVSPVPLNRFAKFAVYRTLPGAISGLMFGFIGPTENSTKLNKLRSALERINADVSAMETLLRHAYYLDQGVYDKDLEDTLKESLGEHFREMLLLLRASQEERLTDAMKPKPMTSLRDVDRVIPFKPESGDPLHLQWFRKNMD